MWLSFKFAIVTLLLMTFFTVFAKPAYLLINDKMIDSSAADCNAISPADGAIVPLLYPAQKAFLAASHDIRVAEFADWQIRKQIAQDGQKPKTVTLCWPGEHSIDYQVAISESPDLTNALLLDLPAGHNNVTLHNLKIATTYYWAATAKNDKSQNREIHFFTTEDLPPRLMDFESINNARDLGGRIGLCGRRIKQGMFFRSAAFNAPAEPAALSIDDAIAIHPEFKIIVDDYEARKKSLLTAQKEQSYSAIPCAIDRHWQMFCPDIPHADHRQIVNFLHCKEIPSSYLGAAVESIYADAEQSIALEPLGWNRPAFFAQNFIAEQDGYMQIGFGADWYGAFAIDGEVIFDFSNTELGNLNKPINTNSFVFDVPLQRGSHIITVYVGSGMDGWRMYCGTPTTAICHKDALAHQLACLEREFKHNIPKNDNIIQAGEDWTTPISRHYLVDTLGIRTDLDLRSDKECMHMTASPLSPNLQWFREWYCGYQNIITDFGRNSFTKIFSFLLNDKNYPLVCHCWGGQDRTGTLAFILGGLLGVQEEELWLDWEATAFYNTDTGFRHEFTFNKMMDVFEEIPGGNITEKCENYVKSCGFSDDDIAKFRAIMFE